MRALTIGQLAKEAQVNVETIRYYERRGLLPEPPRRESGYRQYPPDAVDRILFLKKAQELGFTLREGGELLSLRRGTAAQCGDVKARAEAKIADIKEKTAALERMRGALERLSLACSCDDGPISECPILDALGHGKAEHAAR